jgi:CCR4-NOT transcriptional regulation complex NOT5 subunit
MSTKSISTYKNRSLTASTVKELKSICRECGIKGYSKLKKQELIELIIWEIKQDEILTAQVEKIEEENARSTAPKHVLSYFNIDGWLKTFQAFHIEGDRWNGWECPSFTHDVAAKVLQECVDSNLFVDYEWGYDEENDEFWLCEDNDAETMEKWQGRVIKRGALYYTVYDIGSWSWVWSELTPHDHCHAEYIQRDEIEVVPMEGARP